MKALYLALLVAMCSSIAMADHYMSDGNGGYFTSEGHIISDGNGGYFTP